MYALIWIEKATSTWQHKICSTKTHTFRSVLIVPSKMYRLPMMWGALTYKQSLFFCALIPSQKISFHERMDHLWVKFWFIRPQYSLSLHSSPFLMNSEPEKTVVLDMVYKGLPLCIVEFQLLFLDAVMNCTDRKCFLAVSSSPCSHVTTESVFNAVMLRQDCVYFIAVVSNGSLITTIQYFS